MKSGEAKNTLILVCLEGELVDEGSHRTACERNNDLFAKEIYDDYSSKITSSIKCKPYY